MPRSGGRRPAVVAVARWLRRARRAIFGAPVPALTAVEQFVLDRVGAELPEPDRAVFEIQLRHLDLIQRSPSGRLTALYLDPGASLPPLSVLAPHHGLARVRLSGQGRMLSVTVMAHRGVLSSIEFHGAPGRVGPGEYGLVSVTLPAGDGGIAAVLDRLEHGGQSLESSLESGPTPPRTG